MGTLWGAKGSTFLQVEILDSDQFCGCTDSSLYTHANLYLKLDTGLNSVDNRSYRPLFEMLVKVSYEYIHSFDVQA